MRIDAFEKVMSQIPNKGKVLDVGAAGLEGDNTTDYLVANFPDYTGICIRPEKVEAYNNPNIIVGDFYKTQFDTKFDVIVLDLNIDNNIGKDWTDEGLQRMHEILNPDGYLVNYVMLTTEYGDDHTPHEIRTHADKFWGELTAEAVGKKLQTIPGFELFAYQLEERRPYILWVALRKTDG